MTQNPITPEERHKQVVCDACGGLKLLNPANHGDYHRCQPIEWAEHQGRLLKRILDATNHEGRSKLQCSVCQKGLATISIFIHPKDSIYVLCGECRASRPA